MRLVAYSDARSFGGAEQALANLLAYLDPSYEITVLAVDESVGESVRAARDGTDLRIVTDVRNKFDLRGSPGTCARWRRCARRSSTRTSGRR